MSTTWTEQDEATLRELTERKMRFTDENKEALRVLLQRIGASPSSSEAEHAMSCLIPHAAELRDALAPFDLRKPAPDPIEAAIQRGSFRFIVPWNVDGKTYTVRKPGRYWLVDDETEPSEGGYREDADVRGWVQSGTWRLVE